jgi:hypothetical protein
MNLDKVRSDLLGFLRETYPQIVVRVRRSDSGQVEIQFIEESFRDLYLRQRYHYLMHLIPTKYYEDHLADTVWVELAPGEDPTELSYLDDETIAAITPDVMNCLVATGFFPALDDLLCPLDASLEPQRCCGDFKHTKSALTALGFAESEFSDIFEVLMEQGAFCDCEILYNVADPSRLQANYWRGQAAARKSEKPHKGHEPA